MGGEGGIQGAQQLDRGHLGAGESYLTLLRRIWMLQQEDARRSEVRAEQGFAGSPGKGVDGALWVPSAELRELGWPRRLPAAAGQGLTWPGQ